MPTSIFSSLFRRDYSPLDRFLLKGSLMAISYYLLRILFRIVPFMHLFFLWAKKTMIAFLLHSTNGFLHLLGFNSEINQPVVFIEHSVGVKVINACIGWSTMALFIAFIIAYPGNKKSKFQIIPIGIAIIILANILRITAMAIIVYKSPESLQFYHRYIFNFLLYLVVFLMWFFWVRKYGNGKVN